MQQPYGYSKAVLRRWSHGNRCPRRRRCGKHCGGGICPVHWVVRIYRPGALPGGAVTPNRIPGNFFAVAPGRSA